MPVDGRPLKSRRCRKVDALLQAWPVFFLKYHHHHHPFAFAPVPLLLHVWSPRRDLANRQRDAFPNPRHNTHLKYSRSVKR